MEKIINKRRIKSFRSLENTYIHKITKTDDLNRDKEEKVEIIQEEKSKKDILVEENNFTSTVGPFQLVVIKLPWYKRLSRSIKSFLGLSYDLI